MNDTALNESKIIQKQPTGKHIIETDFGNRTISNQNFSKIVALPKIALMNCGSPVKVNVKLVQENGAKYIKLTPIEYKILEEA